MHDDMIGSDFGSLIPSPCSDNYGEFNLFICMACRGDSAKYVVKAEPTKEYLEEIAFLKRQQVQTTGISQTFEEDILAGRAKDGYVRLCASWVRRFWSPDSTSANFNMLSEPTTIFDQCGVYDLKISEDGLSIPEGSKYKPWDNALKFFNWY